jgi:phosphate transport system substrate-binding protein
MITRNQISTMVWWLGRLAAVLLLIISSTHMAVAAGRPSVVVHLVGAGSTFDAPFFDRAFAAYEQQAGVSVTYLAIGSGGGITQFTAGTVDFGASDVPMSPQEVALAVRKDGGVLQLPIALSGVAIAYNLPGHARPLQLDGPTLARIFLGQITRWNDPAITRLNPGLALPSLAIVPVHRADGSGTTYIFTDYLSAVSNDWFLREGRGKLIPQVVGLSGQGNPGVAARVKRQLGAIGYVDLSVAVTDNLAMAALRTASGAFFLPSLTSISAAAAQFPSVDYRNFSIVNAPGRASYPISGYSWILLRRQPARSANALVALFKWLATTGQQYASALNYVPLPSAMQQQAQGALSNIA